jgi:hypothetical protein
MLQSPVRNAFKFRDRHSQRRMAHDAKPTLYEPVGLERDNELMVGRVCTKGSGDR